MEKELNIEAIKSRKQKLKMLGILHEVYFNRFAVIKVSGGYKLLDLNTNTTYPGLIVNMDHNDGGIFTVQLTEDGLDVVGLMQTVMFVANNSTWLMSDRSDDYLPFTLVSEPIVLEGRAHVYNYYRDHFLSSYCVDSKSNIAIIYSTVKDSLFQHKEYHFLNLRNGKIIRTIPSGGILTLKSISVDELAVGFINRLNHETGFEEVQQIVNYNAYIGD